MNGLYWGLTALHLLRHPEALPRDETIKFVLACQNSDGGFGAAPGHDSHMLYTTSAIQILATVGAINELHQSKNGGVEKVAECVTGRIVLRAGLTFDSYRKSPGSPNRCLHW